jgi:hypothetical protein
MGQWLTDDALPRETGPIKKDGRSRMIVRQNKVCVDDGCSQASSEARRRDCVGCFLLGLCVMSGLGCSEQKASKCEFLAVSLPPGTSIAVAPPINASGCPDIDMIKVADLMASELSTIPGISVIGVNRVLAVMADQRQTQVVSAEHALTICERLGASAIVVFAVTEYNPYTPVVGIVAEIYGPQPTESVADPIVTSRMARPFPVAPGERAPKPWSQVQRTFNAEHKAVQHDVEQYAEARDAYKTPLGWKKYLASQEYYLRYCCYAVARDLVQ